MSISLRIKELIIYKKMNISSFEKKIEVGNNSIGTIINKNSNVSGNILSKILIAYPEVSSDWLLLGKGEMIKKYDLTTEEVNSAFHSVNEPKEIYGSNIELLKDYNLHLKKQVNELNNDKELLQLIIKSRLVNQ